MTRVDLGHRFKADIAEVVFPELGWMASEQRASMLAALLQGAVRTLQIPLSDIEGIAYREGGLTVFALYDNVPGGAGLAEEAYFHMHEVLQAGHSVCVSCVSCAEDSSCYGCLRTFGNQNEHELLSGRVAAQALEVVLKGWDS